MKPVDRTVTYASPTPEWAVEGRRFAAGAAIGPYTLITFLGRGAFGEVWLAERDSTITKSRLAVKLPLRSAVDLDAIRKETEVWAKVGSHPNVLPMFEADIYDGQVVIVSEYAPDGTLKGWLGKHSGKAPSAGVAIDMTTAILNGLEHLHNRNVIHRDLKPANILMQGECPRIADFGLARVNDTLASASLTAGTPAYMAPEAFDGQRSVQTDLWAVGVILFELLAGTRPFPQVELMSLMRAICSVPPVPLPEGTPQAVDRVVRRCLDKEADRRYPSVAAVLHDLRTQTVTEPQRPTNFPSESRGDNLLQRLWDDLDPDLQDALALAHNQARREQKDRISTRTFFAALARLQPGRLPELLGRLPDGSLPEPVAADVPTQSRIPQDPPKLSSCVENALLHLGGAGGLGHKLAPEDVFVDIAKYGTGPSVVRLRTHGVTPELIDRFVGQLGWEVVRR